MPAFTIIFHIFYSELPICCNFKRYPAFGTGKLSRKGLWLVITNKRWAKTSKTFKITFYTFALLHFFFLFLSLFLSLCLFAVGYSLRATKRKQWQMLKYWNAFCSTWLKTLSPPPLVNNLLGISSSHLSSPPTYRSSRGSSSSFWLRLHQLKMGPVSI